MGVCSHFIIFEAPLFLILFYWVLSLFYWGPIHHLRRVTLLCGDLVPDVCNWSLEGMCSKVIPRGADISSGINHWKQYLRASNQSEESGSVSKVDLKAHVVVFVCVSVAAAGDHLLCCCLSPRNSLFSSPKEFLYFFVQILLGVPGSCLTSPISYLTPCEHSLLCLLLSLRSTQHVSWWPALWWSHCQRAGEKDYVQIQVRWVYG